MFDPSAGTLFPDVSTLGFSLRLRQPGSPMSLQKKTEASGHSILPAVLCVGWLIYALPLFVCMPLTSDTVLYDMQAATVLAGGVAYRDIFETNLPGAIWIHMALRKLGADTSVAIRAVDAGVFGGLVLLMCHWLWRCGAGRSTQWLTAFAALLFYFSMSEWCHCQRDTWMLLPALAATGLRFRQLERMQAASRRPDRLPPFSEGLLWAVAFWIKPFVAIPAICCWLLTAAIVRDARRCAFDAVGLLAGGITAGAAGIWWLWQTGAWPHLLEVFTTWNPEYFSSGRNRWSWQRFDHMSIRFFPWLWIHAVAVPVSVAAITRALRTPATNSGTEEPRQRTALLAALYLGWMLQSFFLQHLMDYIHVPAVLLAIVVVVSFRCWSVAAPLRGVAVAAFLAIACSAAAFTRVDRAALWWECVRSGSTPQIRSALSDANFPNWIEIEPVVRFLEQQSVLDGEVTCYNVHTIHIYHRLGLAPSTPYVGLSSLITLFPSRSDAIAKALHNSTQRYIVTELVESGMPFAEAVVEQDTVPIPPTYPVCHSATFPWSHPVVFRSGRYLVHQLVPPLGTITGRLPGH